MSIATKQRTTTTRIDEETNASVKQAAALQGRKSSELLRDAWDEYLETHREEFAADLEVAAKLLREGDSMALAKRFG